MTLGTPAVASPGGTLGIDVGGTTIKAIRVSDDGRVLAEQRAPTPKPDPTGERVADAVAEVVSALGGHDGSPVGVVVPGIVDEIAGVAVRSANVGFVDAPLRALLEQRLGVPVAFGQDVRAGAVAEQRSGAGRGLTGGVAFVAIGTGVAAAFLIDGRTLVSGGWAGEIGQLVLGAGAHAGSRMEEVASATATAARAGEPDARAVALRVAAGDADAAAVWADTVAVLAESLAGMVSVLGASTIILGGGLAQAGALLLDPLRADLARRLTHLRMPVLTSAEHGDIAAALGAALLARDLRATAGVIA
ncbi:ROK family protein [Planctomonas deserti]|uniref:ROK family protein n=1 Tax=Planctomonas deserti TaxID=2144185 RepID=UPI00197BE77E|nr:ROK family protein [Planctomonas deserti]